jgi:serine/threonine protein phosphatase PrpC
MDVEATAGQLVERANAAGGLDNTTVIVIDAVET